MLEWDNSSARPVGGWAWGIDSVMPMRELEAEAAAKTARIACGSSEPRGTDSARTWLDWPNLSLTRSGFALLQVLFRAAQLHRDSGEQRLSDHLRAILRVRHGDVGATRDSFGDLRLRHDTARFERVADDGITPPPGCLGHALHRLPDSRKLTAGWSS